MTWSSSRHCEPWYTCYGCWRQILVAGAIVVYVGILVYTFLKSW